jgi:hypothetical protein
MEGLMRGTNDCIKHDTLPDDDREKALVVVRRIYELNSTLSFDLSVDEIDVQ